MKQEGWKFASHTWGHLNAEKVSLDLFKKIPPNGNKRWNRLSDAQTPLFSLLAVILEIGGNIPIVNIII